MNPIKKCNKCGIEKPHNTEYFTVKSSNKNGLSGTCKSCEQKSHRERRALMKAKHTKIKRTRPINPKTNKPYQKGEILNGLYVWGVRTDTWDEKEYAMKLLPLNDFIKRYCAESVGRKNRAYLTQLKPWKISVNRDDLIDIFPADMKCPILNIEMTFIAHKDNSIQLDRINPKKGYIKGNIAWISAKANRSKSDSTSEELYKIADWLSDKGL
jgi:hypothetical protein